MPDLNQLGRFQKGAAERLILRTAISALGRLALQEREGAHLSNFEVEECLDALFACLEVLNEENE